MHVGARPAIPSSCPESISALIQCMWAQQAGDRPTARQAVSELNRLLAEVMPGGRQEGGGGAWP